MSDIGDAIGTAIEGGLYAKAIDGRGSANDLKNGHFAEGSCLNCGTELIGEHCHACGQKAHLHRTLGAFLHDLLHGALHFEGRTWRTLPKLVFKPGELTRRYIDGERARFVSPMALFLFVIFLMFAVFQFAGVSAPTDLRGDTTEQMRELARAEVADLRERQAEVTQALAGEDLTDERRAQLEQRLEEYSTELEAIREAEAQIPFLRDVTRTPQAGESTTVSGVPIQTEEDGSTTIPVSVDGNTQMNVGADTGVEWIDEGLQKWRTNPGFMLYKLQTNFYKFSWLLIPLSIPFVWLLFAWKRRFKAYDHAIFVTYSLSFMTLLILTITMIGLAGAHEAILFFSSILIPPIHIYKHLRGAYGLSRFSALWRLAVLSMFIIIVLALFLQLLLLIGIF